MNRNEFLFVTIIFFVTMYPILGIFYFIMRSAASHKKLFCFGIRMKREWLQDAEVKKLILDYRKSLNLMCIILALIPLATLWIPYFSISFTVWMIWILMVIILPFFLHVKGNHRLKELKRRRNWQPEISANLLTERKEAENLRLVKQAPFRIPSSLSILIALWSFFFFQDKDLTHIGFIILSFAAMTLLFHGCALCCDRQRIEAISTDPQVNTGYTRAKKRVLKNLWLLCAWSNTGFTAFFAVSLGYEALMVHILLWGSIVYALLLMGFAFWSFRKMTKIETAYAMQNASFSDAGDDDCWLGGILYYNPQDKHTMISTRTGSGSTANLATPIGMISALFGAAALLMIPIMCIWVILEEFTPIHLAFSDETLTAEHLKIEYRIPIEEVDEIALVEELPRLSRTSGTSMETLQKGNYRVPEEGKCKVLLNPQNSVFLQVEASGTTYYLSGYDDEETRNIFENIKTAN